MNPKRIVGLSLATIGLVALMVGFDARPLHAADPDRYIFEYEGDYDSHEFEARLEEALSGLEGLEALGDLDVTFDLDGFEDFGDRLAEQIESALEHGAVHLDRDFPDTVWLKGSDYSYRFDTERLTRQIDRMTRSIQRDVIRNLERDHSRRAWKVHDLDMDREDIESELRALQREMRRLERELERMDEDDDI
jgi:hypothetical protein